MYSERIVPSFLLSKAMSIIAFVQDSQARFGAFCRISYRIKITHKDGSVKEEFFTPEALSVIGEKRILLRVNLPHRTTIFDITDRVIFLQTVMRKYLRKLKSRHE